MSARMKFEPGQYYKLNDGRKAAYIGKDPRKTARACVFAIVETGQLFRCDAEGVSFWPSVCIKDSLTFLRVVGEWKEPRVVEREVVLVRLPSGSEFVVDKQYADYYWKGVIADAPKATAKFTVEE